MILVNGLAGGNVTATDRGLCYGDGVFRTLGVREGQPLAWRRQFAKLGSDARALGIPCPDEACLRREIHEAAGASPACVVKIVLTRGESGRGYAVPATICATRIVATSPWPQHPSDWVERGIVGRVCRLRLAWQPALAGIKHLNRLENVLARAEWSDPDIAEGVLQDWQGNVISGTMSNVFIAEDGRITTPGLAQCGVAGVTRDRVMDAALRHGVACVVEPVALDRLLAADEVMLVNSLIGVWQVRSLEGRAWSPGAMTPRIRNWLEADDD
jgi:4-amino-4-deoxychorismate lyase